MNKSEILNWLYAESEVSLNDLWARADHVRREHVGNEVHLRGLIEISNYCTRRCGYCGLNISNTSIERYRMTDAEILSCVADAVSYGYGTVVIQAGEDSGIKAEWMADVVRKIKQTTQLAVTLSLGEREYDEFKLWRNAGANRYLLRFETSDKMLYDRIHPPKNGQHKDRIVILKILRDLGYEIGSGVMVGIPGQTYDSLADDILLFKELDLDMIGVGPFIPHPQTSLGNCRPTLSSLAEQVPNTEMMVYKVVALARLVCPEANIPSTTALATINTASGRENGLMRGANVVMPNLTPTKYRSLYEIYPGKACIHETASQCRNCLEMRIKTIGRIVGKGQGTRKRCNHAEK